MFKDYRPLLFFTTIAMCLLCCSLGLLIPVLFDYFDTGLVMRFPTLIVSGFIALASLLSFSSGLVLDTISKKEHQNFEIQMNIMEMISNEKDERNI